MVYSALDPRPQQDYAKRQQASPDARFHGAQRSVQVLGDLHMGETVVKRQQDRFAGEIADFSDRLLDSVALFLGEEMTFGFRRRRVEHSFNRSSPGNERVTVP